MLSDGEPKPDKRTDKSRGGCAPLLILALFALLPVVYVASVGPMANLAYNGRLSEARFRAAYAPLKWAALESDAAYGALLWYLDLWDVPLLWLIAY